LSSDGSSIIGNVDLIYRAFYNLVENAIKYNVDGGAVEIDISKTLKKETQILIKDSGIGITDNMKKHIFEPFYRVDKSRSREMGGAGLGLSIVDSIIKKHGGTITVLDNENGGTCFKIIFPNKL
ncbi:MAG: sensor histidine kinase, partial [Oscillospiraceae bacterium]